MGQWETNAKVRVTCEFKVAGQLMDPTSVVVKIKAPSGTVTTPAYTRQAQGVYYVDVTASAAGRYDWRWEGTGTVQATHEGYFGITESEF